MRLLIVTQTVDKNDPLLGFFHSWLDDMSSCFKEIYVIANKVGVCSLPTNVHIYSLNEKKNYKIKKIYYYYYYILKLIKKVDVIFTHICPEYGVSIFPIALFYNKKIIQWYSHYKVSLLGRLCILLANKVLTASREVENINKKKVIFTGHAINTKIFLPKKDFSNLENNILHISRVSECKKIEISFDMIRCLIDKYNFKNFKYLIVGDVARKEDKEYKNKLQKKAIELGINHYVRWIGNVTQEELPAYFKSAKLMLRMLPSGGIGKTDLESLATGTLLATCSPEFVEKIPGFNEQSYWKEGDIAQFAEKVYGILSCDNIKYQSFSRECSDYVKENHSLYKIFNEIKKI